MSSDNTVFFVKKCSVNFIHNVCMNKIVCSYYEHFQGCRAVVRCWKSQTFQLRLSHSTVVLLTETVPVLSVLLALKVATDGVAETFADSNIGPWPGGPESVNNN